MEMVQMVNRKSWEEFRETGLLWWVNMILHTFGWAICVDIGSDGKIVDAYPARVKFRGFSEANNSIGYINISKYMVENSDMLLSESECQ